ncbi:hypothetical protein DFQ00_108136 [Paenibacillus barcinonensis]|uniref:Uncharacterized protein n=1 Tax=Paenibacillus barcinonensis TaxID=198119 RepID=A0A2V4VQF6_PAEBA|nr:hypothetical protein DFQ00_108136 [Paenibacillus barcinonensis]
MLACHALLLYANLFMIYPSCDAISIYIFALIWIDVNGSRLILDERKANDNMCEVYALHTAGQAIMHCKRGTGHTAFCMRDYGVLFTKCQIN